LALTNLALKAFIYLFIAALAFGVLAEANFFFNAATFFNSLSCFFNAFFAWGSLIFESLFFIKAIFLAVFFAETLAATFLTLAAAFLRVALAFAILALIAAFLAGEAFLSCFLRAATFFAALS